MPKEIHNVPGDAISKYVYVTWKSEMIHVAPKNWSGIYG